MFEQAFKHIDSNHVYMTTPERRIVQQDFLRGSYLLSSAPLEHLPQSRLCLFIVKNRRRFNFYQMAPLSRKFCRNHGISFHQVEPVL